MAAPSISSAGVCFAVAVCLFAALAPSPAGASSDQKKSGKGGMGYEPTVDLWRPQPLPFSQVTGSNVTEIAGWEDVRRLSAADHTPHVVFFYDSLDVNCHRLAPTIEAAAAMLQGFVAVVAVDVRNDNLTFFANAWLVQAVPTIFGIAANGNVRKRFLKTPLESVGAGPKQPVVYPSQDLRPEAIKRWALTFLTADNIVRIDADERLKEISEATDKALREGGVTTVMLFTDKDQTSHLYKAFSLKYVGRARFIEVIAPRAPRLAKDYRVDKFPTLLLFSPKNKQGRQTAYTGKLGTAELSAFLDPHVATREMREEHVARKAQAAIAKAAHAARNPVPEVVTIEDWHKNVLERAKITGIYFSPEAAPQEERTAVLKALSTALKRGKKGSSVSKYVWLNSNTNGKIGEFFGVENGGAGLVFISPKKGLYTPFTGTLTPDGVEKFVSGNLAKGVGSRPFELSKVPIFHDNIL